jgi:hypothetical protein
MASKRLTKGFLQRLARLSSVSAAPLSAGGTGLCHPAENVCRSSGQSACQGGLADARREVFDPDHGCGRQRRWFAGSNSETAKPDADSIATEMIKYAASGRNQGKLACWRDCQLLFSSEVAIFVFSN